MIGRLKSLLSDTMIYGGFTIVGRFLTFLLTPLYSNFLSPAEVGDVSYLYAIIAFAMILYAFGMDAAFFRFYSFDDTGQARKAFSMSYFSIVGVAGLFSAAILIFAEPISPALTEFSGGADLIRLAAIVPLLDSMMTVPFGYLRMKRNAAKFSAVRFALIIISVFLNYYFLVELGWGPEAVFIAQIIANLIGVLILSGEVIKNLTFKIDFGMLKEMLRFGLPTLPAALAAMVLQVADRPILMALVGPDQVGFYQVNYRLGIPMSLYAAVFEYAWKPFYLSRYKDSDAKRLFSKTLTFFSLGASFVFLAVGFFIEFIVRLPFVGGRFINPEYWSGMDIIPIILGGYFFHGCFVNFTAGFHIEKKTKFLPIAVGAAALANVAVNFALVPIIDYRGAAWATLIAYFIAAVVLYLFSRKVYPIEYEFGRIAKLIISTALVYLIFANPEVISNGLHSVFNLEPIATSGAVERICLFAAGIVASVFGEFTLARAASGNLFAEFVFRAIVSVYFFAALFAFKFFTPKELSSLKDIFKRNRR